MIIVKTANGDSFINEKASLCVSHNKEKKKLFISNNGDKWDIEIEDVEMVVYVNDAQPVKWTDEGSLVEKLKKQLDKLDSERDQYAQLSRIYAREIRALQDVVDEIKSQMRMMPEARSWDTINNYLERCEVYQKKCGEDEKKIKDERLKIKI